jgi:hypothetical protein
MLRASGVPHTATMREPLITATLLGIYFGTQGTAKAIGVLQRLY